MGIFDNSIIISFSEERITLIIRGGKVFTIIISFISLFLTL